MNKHSLIIDSKGDLLIHKIMKGILVATSAAIILLVTFYVIIRYITPINFNGFEEIVILLVVWLYFIGSANASREKSHIAADMLDLFIKQETTKQRIKLLSQFVGFAVLAIMLYLSIDYLKFNAEYHAKTVIFGLPMFIYHASLVIGLILMLFYDTCYLVMSLTGLRRGKTLQASGALQASDTAGPEKEDIS